MVKRKANRQGGRAAKRMKATVPRGVSAKNMIVPIKRTINKTSIASTTVGDVLGSMAFYLSDLPVSTEFTNLFSQYRIKSVDIHMVPRVNANLTTNPAAFSVFHYAMDYTNATPPNALADILQYGGCKRVNVNAVKDFHIKLKPQTSDVFYNGAVVAGYGASPENTWVNTGGSSANVAHYGLRYAWQCNSNPVTYIDHYITYSLEFKQAI